MSQSGAITRSDEGRLSRPAIVGTLVGIQNQAASLAQIAQRGAAQEVGTESALAKKQRDELLARHRPGAVEYGAPVIARNADPIGQLRQAEKPAPPEFLAKAEQALRTIRYTAKVQGDKAAVMNPKLKTPVVRMENGKQLKVTAACKALEEALVNGEAEGQVDSLSVKLSTQCSGDMMVTLEGIHAINDEPRDKDGWYQHHVSEAELHSSFGNIKIDLARPFDEDRSSILYYYGAQILNRDASKRIMAHPADPSVSYVMRNSLEANRLLKLGNNLVADQHGLIAVKNEILDPVAKEVSNYLANESGLVDINKLAIRIEPIGHTDLEGKPIPGSANFTALRPATGNKISFSADWSIKMRMVDRSGLNALAATKPS